MAMRAPEHHHDHRDDEFDRGLAYDIPRLLSRRGMLSLLAGAGAAAALAACGSDSGSGSASTAGSTTSSTTGSTSGSTGSTGATGASCEPIPEETGLSLIHI